MIDRAAPIAEIVTSLLIALSWQIAILGGLVLLICHSRWLRSATHRHRLLSLTVVTFLLLIPVNLSTIDQTTDTRTPRTEPLDQLGSIDSRSLPSDHSPDPMATNTRPNVTGTHPVSEARPVTWQSVMASFWLLGVMGFGLRLSFAYRRITVLKRSASVPDDDLHKWFRLLVTESRASHSTRLRLSDQVTSAVVVGCFRPMVLLPMSWAVGCDRSTLELVLLHELTHIARGDLWIATAQRCLEVSLFFHPIVWMIGRSLDRNRELSCDARVVEQTGSPLAYARMLTDLAVFTSPLESTPCGAGLGDNKMMLLQRVRNVLGQTSDGKSPRRWGAGLLSILVLGGLIGVLVPVASAFDNPEKSAEARERGDRDPERREREERFDGDRERGERERGDRERNEREREGRDRDREDGERGERDERRDGDRPFPPREREGDREREDREREGRDREGRPPFPPRDGDRPRGFDGERGDREGFRPRPPVMDREMLEAIQQLRREVEMLRREVRELRGARGGDERRGGFDRPAPRERDLPRDGDRPRFREAERGREFPDRGERTDDRPTDDPFGGPRRERDRDSDREDREDD